MKKIKLILVFLLIWTGCGSNNITNINNEIIEGDDIYFFLVSDISMVPSQGSVLADRYYRTVSPTWIEDEFKPALRKKIHGKIWTKESGDCDDATLLAKQLASELNWFDGESALAIGEVFYIQTQGTGHAIIFYLYKENNQLKIKFIEPQTAQDVRLTSEEIKSCVYWRM